MSRKEVGCIQGYECLSASLGNCLNRINKQITGNSIVLLGDGVRIYYDPNKKIIGSDMYNSNFRFLDNMSIDYSIDRFDSAETASNNLLLSIEDNKKPIIKLEAGLLDYNRVFKQAGESVHCVNVCEIKDDQIYISDGYVPQKEPTTFEGWVSKTMLMEAWGKTGYETLLINNPDVVKNYDFTNDIKKEFIRSLSEYLSGENDTKKFYGKDAVEQLFSDLIGSIEEISIEQIITINYQLKIYGFISLKWILYDIMRDIGSSFCEEYRNHITGWNTICSLLLKYALGKRYNKMNSLYENVKECNNQESELLKKIIIENK